MLWSAATAIPLSSSTPLQLRLCRCSSSPTDSSRGFGRQTNNNKANGVAVPGGQPRKPVSKSSDVTPTQAPNLSFNERGLKSVAANVEFEERLEAIRRLASEKKKVDDQKSYGPIDYDAPVESTQSLDGLGAKIGLGVAVIVFGLVFALGDFLPSGSVSDESPKTIVNLSKEERATLQARLQQFEAELVSSPKDDAALEGAAVTLAELGEYERAASYLQDLTKEKPMDPDAFRLLGEVKYELKDYEGSVAGYRSAAQASKALDLEIIRGLTNSLLADKKPAEAVDFLLSCRERLNSETETQSVDPIQIELLLGKAYSDWGHVSDAASVYDQLISSHPNDFRGYLAKGIILKQNGNSGAAERMFIQARFFAPEKAKGLVDRFAGR